MIHRNVRGYGLIHAGEAEVDFSICMPVIQSSDTSQVHRPATQACLRKDVLLSNSGDIWQLMGIVTFARKGPAKALGLTLIRSLNAHRIILLEKASCHP